MDRAGFSTTSINKVFMDMMRQFLRTGICFCIYYQYKLFINNIRSMEVNPFIRKLASFFKGKGVFMSVR